MAKPVGCAESANRIEQMRLTNDAVPLGHHILQSDARYFRRRTRSARSLEIWSSETFVSFVVSYSGQTTNSARHSNKQFHTEVNHVRDRR